MSYVKANGEIRMSVVVQRQLVMVTASPELQSQAGLPQASYPNLTHKVSHPNLTYQVTPQEATSPILSYHGSLGPQG
jgi:hypothetical protein